MGKFRNLHVRPRFVAVVSGVAGAAGGLFGYAAGAGATGEAPYSISSITEAIQNEITGNLAVILGVVGGLLALGIVLKLVRKFAHA